MTLSLLRRAKAAGFTALVVTLDAFLHGWRPHNLDTAYLPSAAGVGVQVGTSDPVFMHRQQPNGGGGPRPAFPLDLDAFRARLAAGDVQAREAFALQEANSGSRARSALGKTSRSCARTGTDPSCSRASCRSRMPMQRWTPAWTPPVCPIPSRLL